MTSVVSALTGSGSTKAAKAQASAGKEAIATQKESLAEQLKLGRESLDLQRSMFQQALEMGAPYRTSGNVALANYESLLYGIPINKTASYQAFTTTQDAGGASGRSREDIYKELLPNYTSQASSQGSMFTTPDGRVLDLAAKPFGDEPDDQQLKIARQLYQKGDLMRLKAVLGYNPLNKTESSVDYNGLNAAVDKRMAPPAQGALSARDEAFAGMDVNGVASWQKTPGYQFGLDEGQKAIERSAAARSGVLSGAQEKANIRFGQDYATKEFGTYMDRLGGVINTGSANAGAGANLTANSANAQSGVLNGMINSNANAAQNIGGLQTQVGAAKASGYLGQQAAGTNILNMAAGFAGGF